MVFVRGTLLNIICLLRFSPGQFTRFKNHHHLTRYFSMVNNDNSQVDTQPSMSAKKMISDTGFYFAESGEFLDESNNKFSFAISDNHRENQARYEKIGDAVTDHIYKLMEENHKLERIRVPIGVKSSKLASFVFASFDFLQSKKKKLVLINGSGAVKAGQWARSIIINDNLYPGSMLPYLTWAENNNFDALVLNTNESGSRFQGSADPFEHAQTVWDNFLSSIPEKCVYIVAHSFGGVVVQKLIQNNSNFEDIVSKIAFTDSVHMGRLGSETTPSINWVTSSKPVNTRLGGGGASSKRSAGCRDHPWTSHFAMDSIFSWFMEDNIDLVEDNNVSESISMEKADIAETSEEQMGLTEPSTQTEPMSQTKLEATAEPSSQCELETQTELMSQSEPETQTELMSQSDPGTQTE